MAKFTAIVIAAVALVAGVQAAPAALKKCPVSGHFCGSELVDVYQCITLEDLKKLTPPFDEATTDLYSTNENGVVGIPYGSCKDHGGCHNSDLTITPVRYATCYLS